MPKISNFRRLPGRVPRLTWSVFVRHNSALWLGADELVRVDTAGWKETTRRFAYADIQALLFRETPRGLIYSVACAGLAAFFGLLAWGMENPVWQGTMAAAAVFFALLLGFNAARGGTCRCVLQTALGAQPLPSLSRRRAARKALALIVERVAAAQGEKGDAP